MHRFVSYCARLVVVTVCTGFVTPVAMAADDGVLLTWTRLPEGSDRFQRGDFSCWLPATDEPIRAVIVHQHGCGNVAPTRHPPITLDFHWRALARKHRCVLLVPQYQVTGSCDQWNDPDSGSERALFQALAEFARQSQRPELVDAPWLLWGHSGGSSWSAQMIVRHPERVWAASFRGGCHKQFGVPEFRARFRELARELPLMFVWGKRETVPTSSHYVSWEPMNAMYRDLRSVGGHVARVIDPESEHGCDNSRMLIIPFFDAVLQSHADKVPLPGALVDIETGSLHAIDESSLQSPRLAWLPNETMARRWPEFCASSTVAPANRKLKAPQLWLEKTDTGAALRFHVDPALDGGLRAVRLYRDGSQWKLRGAESDAPVSTGRDSPPGGLHQHQFELSASDVKASHTYWLTYLDAAGKESPRSEEVRTGAGLQD